MSNEAENNFFDGFQLSSFSEKLNRITSWEQANYILLGFTDLLVTFGAGSGFKLTVLQLWTTYLRRMEIAFFDKEAPELPRLPVFYQKA